jgi:hypothetical protein
MIFLVAACLIVFLAPRHYLAEALCAALILVIACALTSCHHVCPKHWEETTSVGAARGYPDYNQSVSVGGGIGKEECK